MVSSELLSAKMIIMLSYVDLGCKNKVSVVSLPKHDVKSDDRILATRLSKRLALMYDMVNVIIAL